MMTASAMLPLFQFCFTLMRYVITNHFILNFTFPSDMCRDLPVWCQKHLFEIAQEYRWITIQMILTGSSFPGKNMVISGFKGGADHLQKINS